jgi:hypothetical protein
MPSTAITWSPMRFMEIKRWRLRFRRRFARISKRDTKTTNSVVLNEIDLIFS